MQAGTLESPQALGLLSEIATLMRNQAAAEDDLWTDEQASAYLKLAKSSFQQRLATSPGFPRPVFLPTCNNATGHNRRWVAAEIKAWVKRLR